jgi:hypothetical protein
MPARSSGVSLLVSARTRGEAWPGEVGTGIGVGAPRTARDEFIDAAGNDTCFEGRTFVTIISPVYLNCFWSKLFEYA